VGETRRRYTEEFKREAVALSYNSGKTVKEVADDLGINRNLLTRWAETARRTGFSWSWGSKTDT